MVPLTQLRICRLGKKKTLVRKYEVRKLEVSKVSHPFAIELKNRFSCLEVQMKTKMVMHGDNETELEDLETKWENIKEAYKESAKKVLVFRNKKNQEPESDESWKAVEERKQRKMDIDTSSRWRLMLGRKG